jgi:hypothetical protein
LEGKQHYEKDEGSGGVQHNGRFCDMNDLIYNLDKLHITPMGVERIRRNLGLADEDIVARCKECIKRHDLIMGLGKNWYVYCNDIVLTINAKSYTVITAHKLNAKVRVMKEPDYVCLRELLYQAVYVHDGAVPPPRDVIDDPQIFAYIKDFGTQAGDLGVVAEQNGQVVGAAWL